ncbi:unnamed protein product, partial [Ixodes pacificus]
HAALVTLLVLATFVHAAVVPAPYYAAAPVYAPHAPLLAAPAPLYHHAPAPLLAAHPAPLVAHPAPVYAAAPAPVVAAPAFSYSYSSLAQTHPVAAAYIGK